MNASDIGSKLVQYWGKKPLKKFKTFPINHAIYTVTPERRRRCERDTTKTRRRWGCASFSSVSLLCSFQPFSRRVVAPSVRKRTSNIEGKRNTIRLRLRVLVLRRLEAKAHGEKNNSANHRHREVLDGRSNRRLQFSSDSNRSSSAENRNHLPRAAGEKRILLKP